jgi:hypothetical protein
MWKTTLAILSFRASLSLHQRSTNKLFDGGLIMRSLSFLLLLAVMFGQLGCYRYAAERTSATSAPESGQQVTKDAEKSMARPSEVVTQPVSLNQADSAETVAAAADRKIIENAELTLEVASPNEAQSAISSIASSHGGFVVTSETKQTESADPAKRNLEVKLTARVPSNQFDAAVTAIEKLATNVIHRSISGNDVTEEFIDLEARIKTQKALELQFMQILKQAGKIADALEVQRQIADVRTDIEKLEGRKRFLENRSSLSTIAVEIKPPIVIVVSTSGFGRTLRESVSESVDVASAIVLGLTHFVIVMIPIVVLIILPIVLVAYFFVRRAKRIRLAQALRVTPVTE